MKKQLLSLLILASAFSGCPAKDTTWPDPIPEPLSQINYSCCESQLHELPLNYATLSAEAYQGNQEALKKLLEVSTNMDLPTSYVHGALLAKVLKQVKDEAFAEALVSLDSKLNAPNAVFAEPLRESLRNMLEGGFQFQQEQENLADYPATSKILAYQVK
jgi:hypothetical protein